MADHHVQGSFAFTCAARESALIEEAWQHAADLLGDFAPGEPSAEFLAAFMPDELANPFNGLLAIFDDPAFPDFGAELEITGSVETIVSIYGTTDFQLGPIAELIRRCCQESLKDGPVGFNWSYSSSRPRLNSFGGGWCAIFAGHVEFETTHAGAAGATTGRLGRHTSAGILRSMDRRSRLSRSRLEHRRCQWRHAPGLSRLGARPR